MDWTTVAFILAFAAAIIIGLSSVSKSRKY